MKDHHVDLNAIARKAMEKYGFEPVFPKQVIREVDAIDESAVVMTGKDVRDMRNLLWSSLDNIDSMDLDQIEYCEHAPDGGIEVKIAIADVDVFVPKRSQTDRYAAHNGNSVYTGVETFPMIPDRLSRNISSLLPGRDHAALVVEYTVRKDGSTSHGGLYRAIVRNKAKLVYEEIGDWLEGKGPVPPSVRDVPGLEEQLRLQAGAMELLRRYRTDQGALVLNTIEAQPVIEEKMVRDLVIQEQNKARCLIEEFMVAANEAMVEFLGNAGVPMIQRVVRVPKNWEGITGVAAAYGEALPAHPDAKALSQFLIRRKEADPERFPDLSLTIVKLLGSGEYLALDPGRTPYGHFALAVSDYTHATAPNRRYVDLINQRLLKSVLDRKPVPYPFRELENLSEWLSDCEKRTKKVERFVRKAAAAVLLRDRIGETFEAIVTGASQKGTYVRLIVPPAEGRVISGERGLFVGRKIHVRLLNTDPYNGFIDFERVNE